MAETAKNEWEEREIGALWVESGKTEKYMTGTVNGEKVIIFKNKFKEKGDKKPFYRVYKDKTLDGPKKTESKAKAQVEDDDDLPL